MLRGKINTVKIKPWWRGIEMEYFNIQEWQILFVRLQNLKPLKYIQFTDRKRNSVYPECEVV